MSLSKKKLRNQVYWNKIMHIDIIMYFQGGFKLTLCVFQSELNLVNLKCPLNSSISKDGSDLLGFRESTTQYCKYLSTFEFSLELAWLGAKYKGKTLVVIEMFFTPHRYYTATIQYWCSVFKAKHDQVFLVPCWIGKCSNFCKLAVLQSNSMTRN